MYVQMLKQFGFDMDISCKNWFLHSCIIRTKQVYPLDYIETFFRKYENLKYPPIIIDQ